jgi:predicted dithiol-disulfide oxidoreductase (DUF899 family)
MTHEVVTHDKWLAARKKHLAKEKEFTRLRDQLSRERRELPWELVETEYTLEGEEGPRTLAEIFDGRGQLVIYHAMFNPETADEHSPWTTDAACFVCSFWMDNFERIAVHLNHRDITIGAVSRAPYPAIAAYKRRMGWTFPYYSSAAGTSTSTTGSRSLPISSRPARSSTTTGRPSGPVRRLRGPVFSGKRTGTSSTRIRRTSAGWTC